MVGGGLAGATAIETLLKRGTEGRRIALLAAEPELPYHRPPLSKGYLLDREERAAVFVKPGAFYDAAGVTVFLQTAVTAVNPAAHTVTTAHDDVVHYGKLLLATGCTPRTLSTPGRDLPGIYTLRTLQDCEGIKAALRRAKTAVVVGGSFIGMELAAAFAQKGVRTTLLHRGATVFDKLDSPEASAFFAGYYQERGVRIRTEDEAIAFERAGGDRGPLRVTTKRGEILSTDLVAVGVGVTPTVAFLDGSGITLDNGIVVNEYLETSVPDVSAAGDVANFFDPLYQRHRRIEHWDTAKQHGNVAGRNLAAASATERVPYDAVSYFFSDIFDLSFEYFGDATGTTRRIIRGSFPERAVTLFFLEGSTVRAAFTLGRPRERRALIELVRRAEPLPDPNVLKDPAVPLLAETR